LYQLFYKTQVRTLKCNSIQKDTVKEDSMKQCKQGYHCPMEVTLELIGGKWKALLLWHLMGGTLRFHELRALVPQVTPKMLTQQLRDLEKDDLIERKVYPVVPPKVEYSLTEFGKSLIPILDVMCNWGSEYIEKNNIVIKCQKEAL